MQNEYLLSCESTVDMPYAYVASRGIPVLFYSYTVDGVEYLDDMLRDPEALPRFYGFIEDGKVPSTSQINVFKYTEYFERLIAEGHKTIVHIAMGSGMSPSVNNAKEAAAKLADKYPDNKVIVVDSYCSSTGYGMFVDTAADLRDGGASLEELNEWLNAHAHRLHHLFFTDNFKYFKRSGRVSGAAAALGTILSICPVMHIDYDGRMYAYDKVRGKKNAIRKSVEQMRLHAEGGADYSGKCFISHANCPETANELKQAVEECFPNVRGKIRVYDIGTIIASHCGPGTNAVYFFGDDRAKH